MTGLRDWTPVRPASGAASPRRRRVFISHAAADAALAAQLRGGLERDGHLVSAPMEDLEPGTSVFENVARSIRTSDAVVFLISVASAESSWLDAELALALEAHDRRPSIKLLPVVVEDAPVPPLLTNWAWIRMSRSDVDATLSRLRAALVAEPVATARERARLPERRYIAEYDWRLREVSLLASQQALAGRALLLAATAMLTAAASALARGLGELPFLLTVVVFFTEVAALLLALVWVAFLTLSTARVIRDAFGDLRHEIRGSEGRSER